MSENKPNNGTGAGKGDKDRSSYSKKYKDNYDLIDWKKKEKSDK